LRACAEVQSCGKNLAEVGKNHGKKMGEQKNKRRSAVSGYVMFALHLMHLYRLPKKFRKRHVRPGGLQSRPLRFLKLTLLTGLKALFVFNPFFDALFKNVHWEGAVFEYVIVEFADVEF